METMMEKFYPFQKQSENLQTALEIIRDEMKSGASYAEFWTFWTDLPDDYIIEKETIEYLKENGFKVRRRFFEDGNDKYSTIIVAWDDYDYYGPEEDY